MRKFIRQKQLLIHINDRTKIRYRVIGCVILLYIYIHNSSCLCVRRERLRWIVTEPQNVHQNITYLGTEKRE